MGNGWKWMEMEGNGWKWMEMDGNGWKIMEMGAKWSKEQIEGLRVIFV